MSTFDPTKLGLPIQKMECIWVDYRALPKLADWNTMKIADSTRNNVARPSNDEGYSPITFIKIEEGNSFHHYGVTCNRVFDYGVADKLTGYDQILDRTIIVDYLSGTMWYLDGEFKRTSDTRVFYNSHVIVNLASKCFQLEVESTNVNVTRDGDILTLRIQNGDELRSIKVYRGKRLPDDFLWFTDLQGKTCTIRGENKHTEAILY
jgi:hypothetical protein